MFSINELSRMNVIATKNFVDNISNQSRCYIQLVGMGSNFSNSALYVNDTLKFVGCFLVYYAFYLYNKSVKC